MNYTDKIGIMQGRLSKSINGKIQSFPTDNWENEFKIASEIGYSCIEWVIDSVDLHANPLFSANKRKKIKFLCEKYNISIPSVCHDQFMEIQLHSKNKNIQTLANNILTQTLLACRDLSIPFIEIPLVKRSSINNNFDMKNTIEQFTKLEKTAKKFGVKFLLETNLFPGQNAKLMMNSKSLPVGLIYDMGNSAYWGFDPDNELPKIGSWIKNVHVKDCTPKDYTLPLGDGDVDFKKVFKYLKKQKYNGLFILQAAPAPSGQEVEIAKRNYNFTEKQLKKYFYES